MPEAVTTPPDSKLDQATARSSRTWRSKLLAILFGFSFAFLLAEIALRAIGYSSPPFMRPHPVLGAAFKPGIEGWYRLEGRAWNKINSHGYNGPEWTTEKPANTFRIVVLGDSYTAAQQVEQHESFCQQLRQHLQASAVLEGQHVEVLNCGCSGYGTVQQLLVWRTQARHFQADLVLLAFLPGNDLNDNYRPLTLESQMRPYFTINIDDDLVLDDSYLADEEYLQRTHWFSQIKYFVVEHSRLAQLLNMYRLSITPPLPPGGGRDAAPPVQTELGLGDQPYQTPRGEWIETWKITGRLIRQLQQEVLATGAKFGVVCLTRGDQTNPDAQARADSAKHLGMPDLLEPERNLQELCQSSQPPIPLLTLAPGLLKIAIDRQISMHGFGPVANVGHWNQNGHRYAGLLIAEWLESKPALLQVRPLPTQ